MIYFEQGHTVWVREYGANHALWCAGILKKMIGRRTYLVETEGGMMWKT